MNEIIILLILLSLGELLTVDSAGFISYVIKKAKEANASFEFSSIIQKQAFALSNDYNTGTLTSEAFESKARELFKLEKDNPDSQTFWSEWNKMVNIGKIKDKLSLLTEKNVSYVLYSDTNPKHLEKIAKECKDQKITLDTSQKVFSIDAIPLYVSYKIQKKGKSLIEHIVDAVKDKDASITLILGNSENIKDSSHKAVVENENKLITAFCEKNNIPVILHAKSSSLEATLKAAIQEKDLTTEKTSLKDSAKKETSPTTQSMFSASTTASTASGLSSTPVSTTESAKKLNNP